MQSTDFDMKTRELSDEELSQIQGGNILGDAWNAVKNYAGKVVDTVKSVIDFLTHPPKLPRFPDPFPPTIPRPPYPRPPVF